jgi:hypothetical protein
LRVGKGEEGGEEGGGDEDEAEERGGDEDEAGERGGDEDEAGERGGVRHLFSLLCFFLGGGGQDRIRMSVWGMKFGGIRGLQREGGE